MTHQRIYSLPHWVAAVLLGPVVALTVGLLIVVVIAPNSVQFDGLSYWWLLPVVVMLGAICMIGAMRRQRALERFTSQELVPLLADRVHGARQVLRAGMSVLAAACVMVAILGPGWGVYLEKREAYGVDIVVAMDVSRSMLASDVSPDRLERAKRMIREQLTERSASMRDNRLGLVAFAGSASMKVPLTLDHGFFRKALGELGLHSAPRGGTALAETIYSAGEFFAHSPLEATRLILLVTDGDDHEGDALEAAQSVHEDDQAMVMTIGVGDETSQAGAEVPMDADSPRPLLYEGQIVFSRLDADHLRKVAQAGGGQYVSLEDLPGLVNLIDGMKKSRLTSEQRQRVRPRYQWFVAAALVLLYAQALTTETRRSDQQQIKRVYLQEAAA